MSEANLNTQAGSRGPLRLVLAFLLSPIVASFVGSLVLATTTFADEFTHSNDADMHTVGISDMLLLGTLIGATWGQLPILVLSITAHNRLMEFTTRKAWMYAAAGAGAGLVFGGLFVGGMLFGQTLGEPANIASLVVASLAAGTTGGMTFWLIRRPDQDSRPGLQADSPPAHGA